MPLRHVPLLVTLRKLTAPDVSPQMFIILYAVRSHPGQSYSGIADTIGVEYTSTYKSIRHLMTRKLVEDRRVMVHEKTPGVLHATPAGIAFLDDVLGAFDEP